MVNMAAAKELGRLDVSEKMESNFVTTMAIGFQ